jgi:hypothetical protein
VARVLENVGEYALRRLSYGKDLVLESLSVLSRRIFPTDSNGPQNSR